MGVTETETGLSVDPSVFYAGLPPVIPPVIRGNYDGVVALVSIQFGAGSGVEVIRSLEESENVQGLSVVTGDVDAIAVVTGPDLEAVARSVVNDIQSINGVVRTKTSVVLKITPAQTSS